MYILGDRLNIIRWLQRKIKRIKNKFLKVACPKCHAKPLQACVDARPWYREPMRAHLDRQLKFYFQEANNEKAVNDVSKS